MKTKRNEREMLLIDWDDPLLRLNIDEFVGKVPSTSSIARVDPFHCNHHCWLIVRKAAIASRASIHRIAMLSIALSPRCNTILPHRIAMQRYPSNHNTIHPHRIARFIHREVPSLHHTTTRLHRITSLHSWKQRNAVYLSHWASPHCNAIYPSSSHRSNATLSIRIALRASHPSIESQCHATLSIRVHPSNRSAIHPHRMAPIPRYPSASHHKAIPSASNRMTPMQHYPSASQSQILAIWIESLLSESIHG